MLCEKKQAAGCGLNTPLVCAQGDDMTALMMAAANGHEACVRELLYAGAWTAEQSVAAC